MAAMVLDGESGWRRQLSLRDNHMDSTNMPETINVAQALVDEAHQTCPCSKAARGNIDVAINLV